MVESNYTGEDLAAEGFGIGVIVGGLAVALYKQYVDPSVGLEVLIPTMVGTGVVCSRLCYKLGARGDPKTPNQGERNRNDLEEKVEEKGKR